MVNDSKNLRQQAKKVDQKLPGKYYHIGIKKKRVFISDLNALLFSEMEIKMA